MKSYEITKKFVPVVYADIETSSHIMEVFAPNPLHDNPARFTLFTIFSGLLVNYIALREN